MGDTNHELRSELKKHLTRLKVAGVRVSEMAEKLGVTRQAVYQYLRMKNTPGSRVFYNACNAWGIEFEINGRKLGMKDFAAIQAGPEAIPVQIGLLDALTILENQDMKVEVLNRKGPQLELRVLIRFAG